MNKEDVKSIKLTTGEEIVGVVHEFNESTVSIQGPFSVARTMGSSFMLVPWIVSIDENEIVDINNSAITAVAETDQQFFDAYVRVITKLESGEDLEEEDSEVTSSPILH